MSGFLLDTNIPSELTRRRPEARVERWLETVDDQDLFLSVISLYEIVRGVSRLGEGAQRARLVLWLDEALRPWFTDRILPVDQAIAERLGRLSGERDAKGLAIPFADGLLAATAMEHGLTLVTRNVRDFAGLGVSVLNPWDGVE